MNFFLEKSLQVESRNEKKKKDIGRDVCFKTAVSEHYRARACFS